MGGSLLSFHVLVTLWVVGTGICQKWGDQPTQNVPSGNLILIIYSHQAVKINEISSVLIFLNSIAKFSSLLPVSMPFYLIAINPVFFFLHGIQTTVQEEAGKWSTEWLVISQNSEAKGRGGKSGLWCFVSTNTEGGPWRKKAKSWPAFL